jgi:hypothetical protein
MSACAIMIIAAGTFTLVILWSTFRWLFLNTVTVSPGVNDIDALSEQMDTNSPEARRRISEERFRNCVISAHKFATLVKFSILCAWYWYDLRVSAHTAAVFTYVFTAAATLIILSEFRVRKNEVAMALVRTANRSAPLAMIALHI